MSCPTFKKEVGDALAKETVKNGDLFLVSDSGTVYKVTLADIIAALGTTGALQSISPAGSTPVLTGAGPNYQLRSLVGGNGISVGVNLQNAIRMSMQVGNAGGPTDGVPLIVNTTSNTINWRRLRAGNGITIEQDGNRVVVTNSEVAQSSNTQIISEFEDFPTAVSGVIALAENTDYLIVNNISSPARFTMGTNTILRSVDPRANTLTYTGNETMFTCGEGNQVIKEISLSCPNGKLFSNNLTTTGSFNMRWVRVVECLAIGDLSKPIVGLYNLLFENVTGSLGFVYQSGTNKRLVMNQVTVLESGNATFKFLDLGTAIFRSLSLNLIELLGTAGTQTFIEGEPASANLAAGSFGYVSLVEIQGGMVGLSGIVYGDSGWDFSQVDNIPTSNPQALISLSATATTTITTTNTPVVVNGVFTDQNSDYMTVSAAGRITLNERRPKDVNVSVVISGRPTSGTSTFTFYVAKNGAIIADSGISREIASVAVGVVSLTWMVDMDTDDFIEVFVENDTGTTDFEAQKLIFKAS